MCIGTSYFISNLNYLDNVSPLETVERNFALKIALSCMVHPVHVSISTWDDNPCVHWIHVSLVEKTVHVSIG